MKKFLSSTDDYSQLSEIAKYIQKQRELSEDFESSLDDTEIESLNSEEVTQSVSLTTTNTNRRSFNTINTSVEKIIYERSIEFRESKRKNKITMSNESAIISTMQQMINQAVQTVIRALRVDSDFRELSSEREEQESQEDSDIEDAEAETKRWNIADVEYFDSYLNKSYDEDEIVTVEKNIYYRNVMLFVKKIKDIAQIKDSTIVRTDLNECLREVAQDWYIVELFNLERIELRFDINEMNAWCDALIERFKKLTEIVLNKLTIEKYILKDARNRRESISYVQTIVRHVKSSNITEILNQLTFAHESITVELRVFVNSSTMTITIVSFIRSLELKKTAWFDLHSSHASHASQSSRQLTQQQSSRSNYSNYDEYKSANSNNSSFQFSSYQYQSSRQFQDQQFSYRSYQNQFANYSSQRYEYQSYNQYQRLSNANASLYSQKSTQAQLSVLRVSLQIIELSNASDFSNRN